MLRKILTKSFLYYQQGSKSLNQSFRINRPEAIRTLNRLASQVNLIVGHPTRASIFVEICHMLSCRCFGHLYTIMWLLNDISVVVRKGQFCYMIGFFVQNNTVNLDPSYKMHLDFYAPPPTKVEEEHICFSAVGFLLLCCCFTSTVNI